MKHRITTAALFALYQLSLLTGIILMPLAILTARVGITLPIHRLIDHTHTAYTNH